MEPVRIARHKTALRRYSLSRPLTLAISSGVVSQDMTVFDFGCGQGTDVDLLRKAKFTVSGWDPHFAPQERIAPADCVNLGYVLNVIENPAERTETLLRAYDLAQRLLIVAVRVDNSLSDAQEFSDGVLTKVGAFQKLYTQDEFRDYLESTLHRKPYIASLGIAYIFKSQAVEAEYVANSCVVGPRVVPPSVVNAFSKDRIGSRYIKLAKQLGRFPLASEFKSMPRLVFRYGSTERVERIANRLLQPESLVSAREARREAILTYLALMQLQGTTLPPLRLLPEEIKADMKMLWTRYEDAVSAGRDFLFQLGKPDMIRLAFAKVPVGKKLPEDFYLHRSAERQLPALLMLLVHAARQIIGDIDYDVLKIAIDGRKVSFLKYRDFDAIGHPELLYSLRVHLPTSSCSIRDYSSSGNPPILHRKDSLVDMSYPSYDEFAALTGMEEEFGLLSRSDIGTRSGWESVLRREGLTVNGHRLERKDVE